MEEQITKEKRTGALKKEISFSLFLCFLMNMAVLCLEIPPIFSVLLIEFAASQKMTFVNRTATILMPS